jgi:hypothetical protein
MLPLKNPERNGKPKACATGALPKVISNALRYDQQVPNCELSSGPRHEPATHQLP